MKRLKQVLKTPAICSPRITDDAGHNSEMGQSRHGTPAKQVRNWRSNHFAISNAEGNISQLLRSVADALDEIGEAQVLDITFSLQTEGGSIEARMAVYLVLPDES